MRPVIARIAVLTALAVALGMLFAPIPNVEAISAVCFFSGYVIGWKGGGSVGAIGMLLYSLLNPLGPAPAPVLCAQVAGMGFVGSSGSIWRSLAARSRRPEISAVVSGALLTFLYDLVTNYGVAVAMGRWHSPAVILLAGLPLSVVHVASNAAIFGAVAAFFTHKRGLAPGGGK